MRNLSSLWLTLFLVGSFLGINPTISSEPVILDKSVVATHHNPHLGKKHSKRKREKKHQGSRSFISSNSLSDEEREELKEEVKALQGMAERLSRRLGKLYSHLDMFALKTPSVEVTYAKLAKSSLPSETFEEAGTIYKDTQLPPSGPEKIDPSKEPEKEYEVAYNFIKNGEYEKGRDALLVFIYHHSAHPLASDAYYWLAETYFIKEEYEKALQVFAEAYKKFPNVSKSSDCLLKLAMTLEKLKEPKKACQILQKLFSSHPDAPKAVVQAAHILQAGLCDKE